MPRTGDPIIDPHYYLCEALEALALVCSGDGPRDALCLEAFHMAVRLSLGPFTLRLSDLERLRTLFDRAASG